MTESETRRRSLHLESEIQSMQQELQSPSNGIGVASPKLAVEDARRLKKAVDDFRLFLWAYTESWSGRRHDTASTLLRIRLQAVADMLGLLMEELAGKGLPDIREGHAVRMALAAFSQTVLQPK